MPVIPFTLLLLSVIATAGATIALLSYFGPVVLTATLPVFLIATLTLRSLRK